MCPLHMSSIAAKGGKVCLPKVVMEGVIVKMGLQRLIYFVVLRCLTVSFFLLEHV